MALSRRMVFATAEPPESVTRGTSIAATIPNIVTTAKNSINEKPDRLCNFAVVLMVHSQFGSGAIAKGYHESASCADRSRNVARGE